MSRYLVNLDADPPCIDRMPKGTSRSTGLSIADLDDTDLDDDQANERAEAAQSAAEGA